MKTHIIIFGKNSEKSKEVFEVLKDFQNWEVAEITDVEAALEKMHLQKINMVIFTRGIQMTEENKLRKIGTILNDEIIFLHYTMQPSFRKEIVAMLNKQRLSREPNVTIFDSGLRKININLN